MTGGRRCDCTDIGENDGLCGHESPVSGYECTRVDGHDGDHVACEPEEENGHENAVWFDS